MQQEYITKLRNLGYTGGLDLVSLIKACGDDLIFLNRYQELSVYWEARGNNGLVAGLYNTPEEAVANLWIAINKKQ